jgi:hypothetical protein
MGEKKPAAVRRSMRAAADPVEEGQAAAVDITVTNDGDRALYAVDVKASPEGGTYADLPEGVSAEGDTLHIAELPAGETLTVRYQVDAEAETEEDGRIEASVTATGWEDEARTGSVTASASAGAGIAVTTPAPTQAPAQASAGLGPLPFSTFPPGIFGWSTQKFFFFSLDNRTIYVILYIKYIYSNFKKNCNAEKSASDPCSGRQQASLCVERCDKWISF